MKETQSTDFTKKILLVLLIVGAFFTAAWKLEDRIENKIKPIRDELKVISEIRESQVRMEENIKTLTRQYRSCNCDK